MTAIEGSRILTMTFKPPDLERRFVRHHGNHWECAQAWASCRYPEGESGPLTFGGGVMYSYHTRIARLVIPLKGGVAFVLADTDGFSPTTKTKHFPPTLRAAARYGLAVFRVDDIMADTEPQHLHNRRELERVALTSVLKAKLARDNRLFYLHDILNRLDEAYTYAVAVGLEVVDKDALFPVEKPRTCWGSVEAGLMLNGLFETKDFSVLPVLADCLQEAGFDDEDLLRAWRGR